jgi:hypothetical protein
MLSSPPWLRWRRLNGGKSQPDPAEPPPQIPSLQTPCCHMWHHSTWKVTQGLVPLIASARPSKCTCLACTGTCGALRNHRTADDIAGRSHILLAWLKQQAHHPPSMILAMLAPAQVMLSWCQRLSICMQGCIWQGCSLCTARMAYMQALLSEWSL